jgi:hypothetical protein
MKRQPVLRLEVPGFPVYNMWITPHEPELGKKPTFGPPRQPGLSTGFAHFQPIEK